MTDEPPRATLTDVLQAMLEQLITQGADVAEIRDQLKGITAWLLHIDNKLDELTGEGGPVVYQRSESAFHVRRYLRMKEKLPDLTQADYAADAGLKLGRFKMMLKRERDRQTSRK